MCNTNDKDQMYNSCITEACSFLFPSFSHTWLNRMQKGVVLVISCTNIQLCSTTSFVIKEKIDPNDSSLESPAKGALFFKPVHLKSPCPTVCLRMPFADPFSFTNISQRL